MNDNGSSREFYDDDSLLEAMSNEPHFVDILNTLYNYISDDENSESSNSFSENLKRYIPKGIQQIDIDHIARAITIQKDLCNDLNCNSDTLNRLCESPLRMGLISKKVISKPKLFFIYYLTDEGLRLCWMLHNLKTLSDMARGPSEKISYHRNEYRKVNSDITFIRKQRNAIKAEMALNYIIEQGLLTLAEYGDDGYKWDNVAANEFSIDVESVAVDDTIKLEYYDAEKYPFTSSNRYYDDLFKKIAGNLINRWQKSEGMFTSKKINAGYVPITFVAPACDKNTIALMNEGLSYYIRSIAEDSGSCDKVDLQTIGFERKAETIGGFGSVELNDRQFDFIPDSWDPNGKDGPGNHLGNINDAIDLAIATSECYCNYCWQKTDRQAKITKPQIILILPDCVEYTWPSNESIDIVRSYLRYKNKEVWAFFFGEPDENVFHAVSRMIGSDRVFVREKCDYLGMFSWAAKHTYNLSRTAVTNDAAEQKNVPVQIPLLSDTLPANAPAMLRAPQCTPYSEEENRSDWTSCMPIECEHCDADGSHYFNCCLSEIDDSHKEECELKEPETYCDDD